MLRTIRTFAKIESFTLTAYDTVYEHYYKHYGVEIKRCSFYCIKITQIIQVKFRNKEVKGSENVQSKDKLSKE